MLPIRRLGSVLAGTLLAFAFSCSSDENGGATGGSGGSAGSGGAADIVPECHTAADCKLVDDCCACAAYPANATPPSCGMRCVQNLCPLLRVEEASCVAGRCVAGIFCPGDPSSLCGPKPSCPPGTVSSLIPSDASMCPRWGPCVDPTQCASVTGCSACEGGPSACVAVRDDHGVSYHCVSVPKDCGSNPSCECMGTGVCVSPFETCAAVPGVPELTCSCPSGSGATGGAGGLGGSGGASPETGRSTLALGAGHSCALLTDGTVRCWGDNFYGQLGDGTLYGPCKPTPTAVQGLTGVQAVAAGASQTCALLGDATVQCWGALPAAVICGLSDARVAAITLGVGHTCALLTDTTVRCWGGNGRGQLGDGTTADRPIPTSVAGLSGAVAIAAGFEHTCALLADTKVQCWGKNDSGQLGDGTNTDRQVPTEVPGLSGAVAIAAGWERTCALLADSTVRCWGSNELAQLGDGTRVSRSMPTAVVGLTGVRVIALGGVHTCAVLADSTVECWGDNSAGELGDGTTDGLPAGDPYDSVYRPTPAAVVGLSGVRAIALGTIHTCARLADDTVWCWGDNSYGQLGDGTMDGLACGLGEAHYSCRPTPTQVKW